MIPQVNPVPHKKTKRWKWALVVLVVLFLLCYRAYTYWYWPTATVRVGNSTLGVLVADTYEHDVKGWSDRDTMGQYQGMLFYFPVAAQHTMVMRHMRFPLDIIWIDKGVVVDIAKNLPPEPYNKSEAELTLYAARLPSTMVLEIGAGKADEYGIQIGDPITIAR